MVLRAHPPRHEGHNLNSVGSHFQRERLRPRFHEGFDRRIQAHGNEARNRGRVDDDAVAASLHCGGGNGADFDDGGGHEIDGLPQRRRVRCGERVAKALARVVDEDLDLFLVDVGADLCHALRLGEIGGKRDNVDAQRGELGGDRFQAGLVAGHERDVASACGQGAGESQSDPGGSPRHQSSSAQRRRRGRSLRKLHITTLGHFAPLRGLKAPTTQKQGSSPAAECAISAKRTSMAGLR